MANSDPSKGALQAAQDYLMDWDTDVCIGDLLRLDRILRDRIDYERVIFINGWKRHGKEVGQ